MINNEDLKKKDRQGDGQETAVNKPDHHFRMRFDWHDLIEELIQEGQDAGVFDNLPGKGKPLKLDKKVFGSEKALAHELLKSNDLRPDWITRRKLIVAKITKLRANIQHVWARHDRSYRIVQGSAHRSSLEISWDDACLAWRNDIQKINKHIAEYNLRYPSNNLELFKLGLEDELMRVGASRWLK